MLHFDILTLFPKMFNGPFAESIIARAQEQQKIGISTHQLRDYATDKRKVVDDTPCGGGPGMVLKVDVIDRALNQIITPVRSARQSKKSDTKKGAALFGADPRRTRIIMLSASGQLFTQKKALELAKYDNIVLLCGHYEGFDYRVHQHLVDEEISIGEYILTGGEIPAMVIIDTVTRMIPGVIKEESVINESFMNEDTRYKIQVTDKPQNSKNNLTTASGGVPQNALTIPQFNLPKGDPPMGDNDVFDYPVYTRPIEYRGWKVPDVLQSGNHAEINKWREEAKNRNFLQ